MHCYTLPLGGTPIRGIELAMEPSDPVPGVVIGQRDAKDGAFIPIDAAWFATIQDLHRQASGLQECRGKTLTLPRMTHCELEGNSLQDFRLLSRPSREQDVRVLVKIVPPEGVTKVRYTGCYRQETMSEQDKVIRTYPAIDKLVGVEHIAGRRGEVLLVMYPASAIRAEVGGGQAYVYRLAGKKFEPRIIDTTRAKGADPREADKSEAA